jgi:hypothetical protein
VKLKKILRAVLLVIALYGSVSACDGHGDTSAPTVPQAASRAPSTAVVPTPDTTDLTQTSFEVTWSLASEAERAQLCFGLLVAAIGHLPAAEMYHDACLLESDQHV